MGFVGNKQKDKFSEKEGGHEYPEHPPPLVQHFFKLDRFWQ